MSDPEFQSKLQAARAEARVAKEELEADVDAMAEDLATVDEYEDSCPVCHDDRCVCDYD